MLNLNIIIPKLERLAEQFIDEGLSSELHPQAFAAFDPSPYSAEEIERGKLAWQARIMDEYRSMADFASLLEDATQVGLSFEALTCIQRLIRDETRHVELCKRMYVALGGDPLVPGTPNWSSAPKEWAPIHRIYHRVIGSLCVGETMSVSMIRGVRDGSEDPLAKAVMTSLLRDESFHSRLGWHLLAFFQQKDPQGVKGFVERYVPSYIAAARRVTIANPEARESPYNPFGYLNNADRATLALRCIEQDIVRPLEEMGFSLAPQQPAAAAG